MGGAGLPHTLPPSPSSRLTIPPLEFEAGHPLEMVTWMATETICTFTINTPFLAANPPSLTPTTLAASQLTYQDASLYSEAGKPFYREGVAPIVEAHFSRSDVQCFACAPLMQRQLIRDVQCCLHSGLPAFCGSTSWVMPSRNHLWRNSRGGASRRPFYSSDNYAHP